MKNSFFVKRDLEKAHETLSKKRQSIRLPQELQRTISTERKTPQNQFKDMQEPDYSPSSSRHLELLLEKHKDKYDLLYSEKETLKKTYQRLKDSLVLIKNKAKQILNDNEELKNSKFFLGEQLELKQEEYNNLIKITQNNSKSLEIIKRLKNKIDLLENKIQPSQHNSPSYIEYEKIKGTLKKVICKYQDQKETIAQLKHQNADFLDINNIEIIKYQGEIEYLTENLEHKETSFSKVEKKLKEEMEELTSQKESEANILIKTQAEQYQQEYADLQSQVKTYQNKYYALCSESEKYQNENEVLLLQVEQEQQKSLENKNSSEKDTSIKILKGKLSETGEKNNEIIESLNKLTSENNLLLEQLQDQTILIAQQKEDHSSLEKKLQDFYQSSSSSEQGLIQIQLKLEESEKESKNQTAVINTLKDQNKVIANERDTLKTRLSVTNSEYRSLENEVEKLTHMVDGKELIKQQLQDSRELSLKLKERHHEELITRDRKHLKELEEVSIKIRNYQVEIDQGKKIIHEKENLEKKLQNLSEKLTDHSNKIDNLTEENSLRQNIINKHESAIVELDNSLQQKEQQIQNMSHKERKLINHLNTLQKQVQEKENNLRQAQTHLTKKVKESTAMQDYLDQQSIQFKQMQEHINNCKNKIQHQHDHINQLTGQENKLRIEAETSIKNAQEQTLKSEDKYSKMELNYKKNKKRVGELEQIYADYQKLKNVLKNLQSFMPLGAAEQQIKTIKPISFDDNIDLSHNDSADESYDLFGSSISNELQQQNDLF